MSALTRLATGQLLTASEREELLELLLSLQKRAAKAEAKLEAVKAVADSWSSYAKAKYKTCGWENDDNHQSNASEIAETFSGEVYEVLGS